MQSFTLYKNTAFLRQREAMMKKSFFSGLGLVSLAAVGNAQAFSKNDLLTDLNYLNEVVATCHTSNLNPAFENRIPGLIDRVAAADKAAYSYVEFDQQIRTALALTGCYHTVIDPAKLPVIAMENPNFPYKVWTDGEVVYAMAKIMDSPDIPDPGFPARINAVNGLPVADFLAGLLVFQSADGPQMTKGIRLFNKYGSLLLGQYFEQDNLFTIETENGTVTAGHMPRVQDYGYQRTLPRIKPVPVVDRGKLQLFEVEGMPDALYLRITSFQYPGGEGVHSRIIKEVLERHAGHLIIDIRENGGGKGRNAVDLLQYFIREEFSSTDVVPNFKRGKYLGFSMARLGLGFWEAVHLFKGRKTENGRSYRHRCKPHAKGYTGRLYVLVNGQTGSTSTILASYLKYKTDAVLIGEETGGGETGANAGSFARIKLPVSGIGIRFPLVRIGHDLDIPPNHHGVVPAVGVRYSPEDILAGKDLELEKALQLIGG